MLEPQDLCIKATLLKLIKILKDFRHRLTAKYPKIHMINHKLKEKCDKISDPPLEVPWST